MTSKLANVFCFHKNAERATLCAIQLQPELPPETAISKLSGVIVTAKSVNNILWITYSVMTCGVIDNDESLVTR
jgi:hypothetical protein